MNFQQPALRAVKSYYWQILTQRDAICELAYTASERSINAFINNGKKPQFCEESLLFTQKQDVLPASLSASCDAQKLPAEFAKSVQLSTSLLNLPLNIKQTDAARLHQVQLHSTLLPITCSALQPDPVGASSKEQSLILPAPQLLL